MKSIYTFFMFFTFMKLALSDDNGKMTSAKKSKGSKSKKSKDKSIKGDDEESDTGNITTCADFYGYECESFDAVGFCCKPKTNN